jgi:hypothetical protein
MMSLYKCVILFALGMSISVAIGQDVIETPRPDFSTEHREMLEKVFSLTYEGLDAEQLGKATKILEKLLKNSDEKNASTC